MSLKSPQEPLFLLSMPRSGSTLLSLMLGSHPQLCCPPEPWLLLTAAQYFAPAQLGHLPYGRQWAEIATLEFLLAAERKHRGALGDWAKSCMPGGGAEGTKSVRDILSAAYRMRAEAEGKSRIVDKTPRYYAVLPWLDELFPASRKILLLRNPLDVFASYAATWEVRSDIFTVAGVSLHTRDFCEGLFALASLAELRRDDVLVLRYEELVRRPEEQLRKLCPWLGIEYSPAMLRYQDNASLTEAYRRSPVGDPIASNRPAPVSDRSVNGWDQRLPPKDKQALLDLLGMQILRRMGYEETADRLQAQGLVIPTEEEARCRRDELMRALRALPREEPYSSWTSFMAPLQECMTDRAERLRLLEACEADRAERLAVILHQQEELATVRQKLHAVTDELHAVTDELHAVTDELHAMRTFKGFMRYQGKRLVRRGVR